MAKKKKNLGPCLVRSQTNTPCAHPAVFEIWGIPFCEPCALEQEAYFAVGELTEAPKRLYDDRSLVRALNRMR